MTSAYLIVADGVSAEQVQRVIASAAEQGIELVVRDQRPDSCLRIDVGREAEDTFIRSCADDFVVRPPQPRLLVLGAVLEDVRREQRQRRQERGFDRNQVRHSNRQEQQRIRQYGRFTKHGR